MLVPQNDSSFTLRNRNLAEVILKSNMSNDDIDQLLAVFNREKSPDSQVTFKSHQDIKRAWQIASQQFTHVKFYILNLSPAYILI